MVYAASVDQGVLQFFVVERHRTTTYRKELLLPAKAGRPLGRDEDFVEVYLDDHKAGWVYFSCDGIVLQRIGMQRKGETFHADPGERIRYDSIDARQGTFTLIDGREFQ